MNNKLSADPSSIILGIIALVLILLGCCCGFLSIISLILSIIGLVLANKSISEYKLNSENYAHQSAKNVNTGKILSIIGLVLSALLFVFWTVYFSFFGFRFYYKIVDQIRKNKNNNYDYKINDSVYDYLNNQDSLYIDSVEIEKIQPSKIKEIK